MAEPSRLRGQTPSNHDSEGSDIDAEGEEDDMEYDTGARETTQDVNTTDAEGSDVDAEGEEVEDDTEPVGAVKIAAPAEDSGEEEEAEDDDDGDAAVEDSESAKTSDSEESDSSSSESDAENEWEAESDAGEGASTEIADPNRCIYCGDDEEHDPSEEFEEYLACAVCGDNSHRQCARNAKTLRPEDDPEHWRCTTCVENGLEEDTKPSSESVTRRRLSSVPKLARDLLPSHRGVDPGGHSIFNDLILPDDPVDGSRSLRKRKASHEDEPPLVIRPSRKKRRSSESSKSEVEVASHAAPSPQAIKVAVSEAIETDDARASGTEGESRTRASRPKRSRPQRTRDRRPLVWIEDSAGLSLVVAFHLNNERVQKILSTKPKKKKVRDRERDRERERERGRSRKAEQVRPESPEVTHYPAIQPQYAVPFYSFADREMDETKNKPYGGILSEADADTSKTYPTAADRKRFEDARTKAEENWKQKQAALYGSQENPRTSNKSAGPPSKIKCISFGGYEIDTWHAAPYPEEYSKNKVLYICEFCLKYMNSDYVAWRHKLKCPAKHPPGDEIYRDGKYSFFEVDGRKNPVYCQNLCLLAKLFLGSKTLYYDVEPFLFYVMTENNELGCHFVGYFSKEKRPSSLNNVSCILVLPIHQRKGYGQFLIEFSYLLTRVEKKTGSPEKPLSDMGLVTYRIYWRLIMCQELLNQKTPISISMLSEQTGMTPDDIVSALEGLRVLVRDPITKKYAFRLDHAFFKQYINKYQNRGYPKINPDALVWTPYVMGRTNLSQYEDGPAIHTVQPREELEDEEAAPEEGVQMAEAAKTNGETKNGETSTSASKNGVDAEDFDLSTPALTMGITAGSPGPGTPLPSGITPSVSAMAESRIPAMLIPPSRFEVFPPIPGMPTAKRRAGRPFGARRRTQTPQRPRNLSITVAATAPVNRTIQVTPVRTPDGGRASPGANGVLTPGGSITLRRTRSKLTEVVNGLGEEEEYEGGSVKGVNGTKSQSASGSPKTRSSVKGKGKAIEPDEDADGEYEPDVDAEGEDEDAEGEEDTVDVVMGDA